MTKRRILGRVARVAAGGWRRLARAWRGDPEGFLAACRSIVHVGANTGQERETYARQGLEVLWVEPIPDVFERLRHNIAPYPAQRAVRALVTDRDGDTRTLNIASNEGASSSILDLALHKDIWPEIAYVDQIAMSTTTLDTLMATEGVRECDALILDTQGSELMALVGGARTLSRARFVKVECADFESYSGCATCDEISAHLAGHGFRLKRKTAFARRASGGTYYDALYERRIGT